MNPYLIHDLAIERQREAHRFAADARLAALARCCSRRLTSRRSAPAVHTLKRNSTTSPSAMT
jgi:hypothetical protein